MFNGPDEQFVAGRAIGADGGMWKLTARQTVKAFLEERFAEEIATGTVVVAL